MTSEQIERLFYENGYNKISSNLPEYNFYWRKENQGITVVFAIDYRREVYISADQYAHMKEKIAGFFRAKGEEEIHILSLILSTDIQKAKALCVSDSFCWMIDVNTNRLIIHENQVDDFYGLKKILEDYMTHMSDCSGGYYAEAEEETLGSKERNGEKWSRERIAKLPWVNICLVAVNVIVFLICTFTGKLLYNRGALSVEEVLVNGEFYRLFTSMFLHWNVEHLFSNMIVLYYVGAIVERELGTLPYTALYLLSGLMGNLFSIGYEWFVNLYGSSAGASGAVFGVEGALLFLVMIRRGRLESMTLGRVAFAVAFSLYCGFTSAGVNNAAHVGGVLMGFTAAAAIVGCRKARQLFSHRSR